MNKREHQAIEILQAGGYFREQLETDRYMHREQFCLRLRDANGSVVKGIGRSTFYALQNKLTRRDCPRSTVWPSEYVLAA